MNQAEQTQEHPEAQIGVPAELGKPLYFHCSACGECCSSFNIPIEGEKARALLEKDWVQARLRETRREIEKVTEALYRLPLSDENVCVFLGKDRRCTIEANEGPALKPTECKRFPFASVKMPDGSTLHDTSAACKLIADKLVLAFEPILPRPSGLEEESSRDDLEQFPSSVHKSLFGRMKMNTYSTWLTQAREVLSNPELPTEQALHDLAWALSGRKSRARAFRFHTGLANALAVLFLRRPYGTLSLWSLVEGKTYSDARIFGEPVDLRAHRLVRWNPDFDHHVNAFLYGLVSRKLPLSRGGTVFGLLAMASVACLLVRWYARMLASIRACEAPELASVSREDVTMAIRLVERYYTGHQPRFLEFFRSPWKSWVIVKLLLG